MASRNFNRVQALEKEVKHLYAEVAIGGTGAPTLTSGLGITSISRVSAGKYLVTLNDKYVRLMSASAIVLKTAGEDITVQLSAQDVAGAKTVTFLCKTAATATDPASGDVLFIRIDLKNSTSGE